MLLTEIIKFPSWLNWIVYFHVFSATLAIFMFVQFFTFKNKKVHRILGYLFSFLVLQTVASALFTALGMIYFFNSIESYGKPYYAVLQSFNSNFATLFSLAVSLEIRLRKKITWLSHSAFWFFVVVSIGVALAIGNTGKNISNLIPSVLVNAFCFFYAVRIAKVEGRQTALHGFFAVNTFLYLIQGLIDGGGMRVFFAERGILQSILGYPGIQIFQLLFLFLFLRVWFRKTETMT